MKREFYVLLTTSVCKGSRSISRNWAAFCKLHYYHPQRMKKSIIGIVLLTLILSCKNEDKIKNEFTCGHAISYSNGGLIAFVGYDTNNLKQVRIQSFVAGSNFSDSISDTTVTIFAETLYFHPGQDTMYPVYSQYPYTSRISTFYNLDYKITTLPYNRTYVINNIVRGDTAVYWISNDQCSPGSIQTVFAPFVSVAVDGVINHPVSLNDLPIYYIYLKK